MRPNLKFANTFRLTVPPRAVSTKVGPLASTPHPPDSVTHTRRKRNPDQPLSASLESAPQRQPPKHPQAGLFLRVAVLFNARHEP